MQGLELLPCRCSRIPSPPPTLCWLRRLSCARLDTLTRLWRLSRLRSFTARVPETPFEHVSRLSSHRIPTLPLSFLPSACFERRTQLELHSPPNPAQHVKRHPEYVPSPVVSSQANPSPSGRFRPLRPLSGNRPHLRPPIPPQHLQPSHEPHRAPHRPRTSPLLSPYWARADALGNRARWWRPPR